MVPTVTLVQWDNTIDVSVQDCSISGALAMEILQSCTKPLMSLAECVPSAYIDCNVMQTLRRKCHFDEIFVIGCTRIWQLPMWRIFRQNDDISVSVAAVITGKPTIYDL